MAERFAQVLENWYETNKRELPWRNTRNPYRIWISEIILQQTRVVQGYGYFLRFVERFPDVRALAEATEDEVMKMWQGLGYYSRARNLHAAAQSIVEHGGEFPQTYAGVRALKGVGDYTAAAICSFAYGLPHAVVDGNVYRVLSRWMGIDTPIDTTEGKKLFAALAQELLDKEHPSIYNQAIMDFGAIQCTPQSPNCLFCPLSDSCVARMDGCVDTLPAKARKTQTANRYFNYIYVRAGACTFINKRAGNDIWRNLYELPLIEADKEWAEEELYASETLQAWMAPDAQPVFRCIQKNVKHVLSHRVIHANFYEMVLPEETTAFAGFQRIPITELHRYAVPRLVHRFLEKHVFG